MVYEAAIQTDATGFSGSDVAKGFSHSDSHPFMNTENDPRPNDKIVLCVPRWCGLNDTLVQIWFAYQFALSQGRQLHIDTRISGLWDDLDNYLVPHTTAEIGPVPITLRVTDKDLRYLNRKQASPRLFQGRLDFMHREIFLRASITNEPNRLRRSFAFAFHSLCDRVPSAFSMGISRRLQFLLFVGLSRNLKTNQPLNRSTDQPLVIRYASGGGSESLHALELFRFSPTLQSAVQGALSVCGDDFDAIHVRNTDIRSDYETLFAKARKRFAGRRVLVCSDDSTVITAAREQLLESDVFTVTTTEATHGMPLHKLGSLRSPEQRRLLNFNMFIDLICLSQGRELLVARSNNGQLSGFSALAQSLHSRSDIVRQLVKG